MPQIYQPAGRAREYSPLALNYFTGCDHGCQYCYVQPMMSRFRKGYNHNDVKINVDYKDIERSAKKMQGCNEQILFSFTTDPYTLLENGETRKVLEILNFYGHKVAILTKSGKKYLRDIDIFKKFGKRIKIGASLTFDNRNHTQIWERNAATPQDRIDGLKEVAENGIITWASFEPTIIPEQSLNLLTQVVPFIDHVKIGKINNFKGIDKKIDWNDFISKAVKILREANMSDRFYIKKDLLEFNKDTYLSANEINQDYLNL